MDLYHFKNSELEKVHMYKVRAVSRGDVVKDDSGSCAVFIEQGSSASHMTAAKVLDVISKLPGCEGQASDAVSAYTHVKMEDAPKLLGPQEAEANHVHVDSDVHKRGTTFKTLCCHMKETCADTQ